MTPGMIHAPLPASAAWRHHTAREGVEVLHVQPVGDVRVLRGHTTAVEDGVAWTVGYAVHVDAAWRCTRAELTGRGPAGERSLLLERGGDGWRVDGVHRPELDGCLDVDLESSAVTNTLPVHRLGGPTGPVSLPAAFVRAADLRVERLEQTYERGDDPRRVAYAAPVFDVACTLVLDDAGLVVDYPGLATRIL